MKWYPMTMQLGSPSGARFGSAPINRVPFGYEALRFAGPRGYVVCFRTDTGKAHIAKPMGQTFEATP